MNRSIALSAIATLALAVSSAANGTEERIGSAIIDLEAGGVIFPFRGTSPIGDRFAIYERIGGAPYDIDVEARQSNLTLIGPDGTQEDVTYGAGVEFNLDGSVALRLEYEAVVVWDGDQNLAMLNALFKSRELRCPILIVG